jgi:hypothetical protein
VIAPRPNRTTHRIFLDANVLFSAAYRIGSGLQRLWQLGPATLVLSTPYAIEEARRNLVDEQARVRLDHLVAQMTVVSDVSAGELPAGVTLPVKDRPILLAAIAIKATHLLTGDRAHFGAYFGRQIAGVRIERPGDYLQREWKDSRPVTRRG